MDGAVSALRVHVCLETYQADARLRLQVGYNARVNRSACLQTQEMWSAIMPTLALVHAYSSGRTLAPAQALFMGMFLLHYTWRSFVYPFLLRGGKPTPVGIWLMACAFCMYNGYLQV